MFLCLANCRPMNVLVQESIVPTRKAENEINWTGWPNPTAPSIAYLTATHTPIFGFIPK